LYDSPLQVKPGYKWFPKIGEKVYNLCIPYETLPLVTKAHPYKKVS